jgi:hypothetical protein
VRVRAAEQVVDELGLSIPADRELCRVGLQSDAPLVADDRDLTSVQEAGKLAWIVCLLDVPEALPSLGVPAADPVKLRDRAGDFAEGVVAIDWQQVAI